MQTTGLSRAWRWRFTKPVCCVLACLPIAWICLGIYLALNWPFTERRITADLEHFSSCKVKIQHFHQVFVLHPGYVAEGFTFWRRANGHDVQIASVNQIACSGSWISMLLFEHHVHKLTLDGVHVLIPSPVPPAISFFPGMKDKTTVETLVADGAVLDIAPRKPGGKALKFAFEKLLLHDVKKQNSIPIETVVQVPMPPGRVSVRGSFGPFVEHRLGDTALSGSYALEHADLDATNAVGGMLNSRGSFRGTLAQCRIAGSVMVDNFQVHTVRHGVKLSGHFDTTLDALKGEAVVHSVGAQFEKTDLQGSGTIQSGSDQLGKVESFSLTSKTGRIEDLLWLFTSSPVPALRGPISLSAKIVLPPGNLPFLKKLQMNGKFDIENAEFLHANTERSVETLSARARGHNAKNSEIDGRTVLSSFDAQVVTRNGTATLSHADFRTIGAKAWGNGTYNLLNKEVNLEGKIAIEASLSKAAGGVKGMLLVPLDPFFKKGNAGAQLPIHVTGTYSHPQFRVSLRGGK